MVDPTSQDHNSSNNSNKYKLILFTIILIKTIPTLFKSITRSCLDSNVIAKTVFNTSNCCFFRERKQTCASFIGFIFYLLDSLGCAVRVVEVGDGPGNTFTYSDTLFKHFGKSCQFRVEVPMLGVTNL